jgi:predicted RNA-binding Zn ribbon-like protein
MATDEGFRFDCGATWLNLLATKGRSFGAKPVERLGTVDRLADWLACCELAPTRAPRGEDLRQTVMLRETLRELALATVDERAPDRNAIAALGDFLVEHDDPVRLRGGKRLRREPPAMAGDALARIARQAVDQLTGADRAALKACPEHDCRGVFIDPPGRRRWCPSPACASRGRVRALRARRAEADRQEVGDSN